MSTVLIAPDQADLPTEKFSDPLWTAKGERRATVGLKQLETLWLNSGTLCNLACVNCYIESTPTNDALVYLRLEDTIDFLDDALAMGTREVGITGGEPFMNPDMIGILEAALERGFDVLVLTNAMRPMMRPKIQAALLDLNTRFGDKLTLRVSLDHYTQALHDEERGEGSFEIAEKGLRWLADHQFNLAIAGRAMFEEDETAAKAGYAALIETLNLNIDVDDIAQLVLFPEMRAKDDPPEITTACWGILDKSPNDIMCSKTRMVVHRKGADKPAVLACTLIAYDERFELGETLQDANIPVSLNHPWCATFCVLGGASCS